MKVARPFPVAAYGRSVAPTGMIASSIAETRIKVLSVTKRFMMISFISIQNNGALRFEVADNHKTSHQIFNHGFSRSLRQDFHRSICANPVFKQSVKSVAQFPAARVNWHLPTADESRRNHE